METEKLIAALRYCDAVVNDTVNTGSCNFCPYRDHCSDLDNEAADALERLTSESAEKDAEIERLKEQIAADSQLKSGLDNANALCRTYGQIIASFKDCRDQLQAELDAAVEYADLFSMFMDCEDETFLEYEQWRGWSEKENSDFGAYKATGLEPEDMKRAFNDDAVLKLAGQALGTTAEHLRNLLSIEKDGRLWMSPVPLVAGTKLYCPRKTDVQEQTLQYITLLDREPTIYVSFECDYECDGCPHNAPYTNYDAGDGGCDGEGGFGLFNVSDVGKTVFLTSDEAVAALRGDKR